MHMSGNYIIMIENIIKNVQRLKEKGGLWVMISKIEPSAPVPVDTDVKQCLQG